MGSAISFTSLLASHPLWLFFAVSPFDNHLCRHYTDTLIYFWRKDIVLQEWLTHILNVPHQRVSGAIQRISRRNSAHKFATHVKYMQKMFARQCMPSISSLSALFVRLFNVVSPLFYVPFSQHNYTICLLFSYTFHFTEPSRRVALHGGIVSWLLAISQFILRD